MKRRCLLLAVAVAFPFAGVAAAAAPRADLDCVVETVGPGAQTRSVPHSILIHYPDRAALPCLPDMRGPAVCDRGRSAPDHAAALRADCPPF